MLNEEEILARANELYGQIKAAKHGPQYADSVIQMDGLKCVLKALVEALNAKVQI